METVLTDVAALSEIFGWIGAGLILLAYFLLSTDVIQEDDRSYHLLNLFGSVGIGVNVFTQGAWPALGLQVAFSLIALYALFIGYKATTQKPSE